jgi:hypothetical protein
VLHLAAAPESAEARKRPYATYTRAWADTRAS